MRDDQPGDDQNGPACSPDGCPPTSFEDSPWALLLTAVLLLVVVFSWLALAT